DGAMAEQIHTTDRAARRLLPSAKLIGRLGQTYHANDFGEEALACYALAERVAPRDYRWPYCAGLVTYDAGQRERAYEHFTRALHAAENAPWIHLRRGDALLKLNQLSEAKADYQRAVSIQALQHEALVGLARVAERQGAWDEVTNLLEKGLLTYPSSGPMRRLLAAAYRQTGLQEQAKKLLSPVHTILPFVPFDDPLFRELEALSCSSSFLLKQATLAFRRRKSQHAGNLLRRLVAVAPADPDGHAALAEWARGEALDTAGRIPPQATQSLLATALREARIAIDLAPRLGRAHITLGATLEAAGDTPASIEAYSQALRAEPDLAEAHRCLGVALSHQGRFADAETHCRKAQELEPMNPNSLDRLGYVLAQSDRWEEAIVIWEESAVLDPASPAPQFNIARGLVRLGKKGEAQVVLKRLLKQSPGMQIAVDLLAKLEGENAAQDKSP
ncbi:MAG: tetratricopeptide repeat protein, partial [Lentisphaerae bacterium]|nr:tetratricopeptide repeat protein [Lentisphaerota bacterium]